MKLDALSCDLISSVFFHGEKSISQVAQELGVREHRARRALKRLLDSKVIYPNLYVNPQARGVQELQVYLKLLKPSEAARKRLVSYVANAANVTFARSVGGPFELDVLLCVRSLREVSRFFDALSTELKNIEYTKVIAADVGMRFYPPKFLGGLGKEIKTIGWSLEDETHSLDEVDQRVLLSLVKTGWTSQSACARAAGLPVSTFEYRVKSLRQKKVILAFGYMLRASTLDLIPYTYLIQVSKSNRALKERFYSFCLAHPNVTYCTESLGGWDFEIGAKFKANVDAQLFLDSLARELDDCIGSITTIPIYRPVNVALKFTEQFR